MIDINIVTPYDSNNFGAMLQAYALKLVVEMNAKGKKVAIYKYDLPKQHKKYTIKRFVQEFAQFIDRSSILEGNKKFEQFRNDYFNLSKEDSYIYISGSDQIWNPNNFQPKFFLDFVPSGSVKASYAASLGVSFASSEQILKICENLNTFNYISVRENNAKILLKNNVNKNIFVHVDPTLLLSKNQWITIEKEVSKKLKDYILVYLLHIHNDAIKIINQLKKMTKKKVVLIDRTGVNRFILNADYVLSNIGPQEFLWLFDHADYVVTSSFHGTVFSIIYEKKFIPLINPNSPSRINNLLELLEIKVPTNTDELVENNIDWKKVNELVTKEQNRSKEYLLSILR